MPQTPSDLQTCGWPFDPTTLVVLHLAALYFNASLISSVRRFLLGVSGFNGTSPRHHLLGLCRNFDGNYFRQIFVVVEATLSSSLGSNRIYQGHAAHCAAHLRFLQTVSHALAVSDIEHESRGYMLYCPPHVRRHTMFSSAIDLTSRPGLTNLTLFPVDFVKPLGLARPFGKVKSRKLGFQPLITRLQPCTPAQRAGLIFKFGSKPYIIICPSLLAHYAGPVQADIFSLVPRTPSHTTPTVEAWWGCNELSWNATRK
ncbi:hypothetical protein FB451DRAFT_1182653 [Mycena latifolia]|nr:hypothetical protein FB451DRAFT_1182653 [Mycena latifolia]